MKILMKPISMISWSDDKGIITPIRFRIEDQDENIVIRIQKITLREKEKLAGNYMLVYRCQSVINGICKPYELKYEIATCKWYLYKM